MKSRSRRATVWRIWSPYVFLASTTLLLCPATLLAQGPPNPPVNLDADVTSDQVRLTWDADDSGNRRQAVFFRIYRDQQFLATSGDEVHTDTDVQIGAEYTYEVTGVDVLGREGEASDPLTVVIPDGLIPDRPRNLVAAAVSASQIDLDWDAVCTDPGDDDDEGDCRPAALYYIYRDGGASPIDSVSTPGYSDANLAAFTVYSYRVSAVNVSGLEGEKSAGASARTFDGTAPTAPPSLTATGSSGTEITLGWDPASDPESGVDRYLVYRDGAPEPFDSTAATTYTDSGLSGWTDRVYEVAAVNGVGLVGPKSNAATGRPLDATPPNAPPNVAAEATGARLVELSWDPATDPETGVSSYLVYRDGSALPLDSTSTPGYSDGTVQPETSYSYRVTARNGDGLEGPPGGPAEATTPGASDPTPPTVPGDFAAAAVGPERVDLTWSAAEDPESGIAQYRVYRDDVLLGTSPGGGFSDLTVEPESSYAYRVSAVNGDGLEGAPTAAATVTTPGRQDTVPPAPPTNLRVVTE